MHSQDTKPRTAAATAFKPRVRQIAHGRYLVESATQRGIGHQVTATNCTCKGFAYRGACRHIMLVQAIEPPMQAWYGQSAPAAATRPASMKPLQEAFGY